ncbi:hypothetical protein HCP63_003645 [Salmonella enterica subsp. arizonae]|nr:hypothetical protein [Salmonella enterica subsp. arizonae]EFS7374972.1 hypothetical protein [Salmonella enterica]EHA8425378.1 hypothetical protein [Salmonella enterica subsp. arizonae serovar 41:z4,z23:-]EHH2346283.1 hypothetical protein [Salmonella enterica]HAU2745684.1 hypothetical protein [Salmonella enterica subsp. arizonae]
MSLWLSHPLFLPSLVVGITVLLWATSLLPEFITALLFFTVAMAAKIAPPDKIFGGFASSAFWLVFSGFVLGIAIRKTGLADRAARALSAVIGQINGLLAINGKQCGVTELCSGVRDALKYGAYCAINADCRGDGETCRNRGWHPRLVWAGVGRRVWHLPAFRHYFTCERTQPGDERRGRRILWYPSELCTVFTAAYADTGMVKRRRINRPDLLAISRRALYAARGRSVCANEPQ